MQNYQNMTFSIGFNIIKLKMGTVIFGSHLGFMTAMLKFLSNQYDTRKNAMPRIQTAPHITLTIQILA